MIDNILVRTLTDSATPFTIGKYWNRKRFAIFKPSLGKIMLMNRILKQIDFNPEQIKANSQAEILRACKDHKPLICQLIAYSTFYKRCDLIDSFKVQARAEWFGRKLSNEECATLLSLVLIQDDTMTLINGLKILSDRKEREHLISKQAQHYKSFGGVSIYGSLIDVICHRYGWTFDEVVWGVSYSNIQLLLHDQIIQLPGDPNDAGYLDADDPSNWERINQILLNE